MKFLTFLQVGSSSLALGLLLGSPARAQAPMASNNPAEWAETITATDLEKHLRVLAADDMEGRETGTPGQKRAAVYIARQFAALKLTPVAHDATGAPSYYQPFSLYRKSWGDFYIKAGDRQFGYRTDFIVNGLLNVPNETGYETVFAGYGINDGVYDDYTGLEVKGKAVVFFDDEPKTGNGSYVLSKTMTPSKWGGADGLKLKIIQAKEKGAAQIIVVSQEDAAGFRRLSAERAAMMGRFNRLSLTPGAENVGTVGAFIVTIDMGATLLNSTPGAMRLAAGRQANKTMTTPLTATVSTAPTMTAPTTPLRGSMRLKAERHDDIVMTENVMGLLEGTDKRDEVLVVSGHYDHIGMNPDGQVNNGANDDGSGTVSVLEIAQGFAQAKAAGVGPRRSILFLTVVGEEKGLLGSQYYADIQPVIPLENTVADLNIDMVGRVDDLHKGKSDNYIYVIGSDKLSGDLHDVSEETNGKYIGMELDYKYNDPNDPERIYYRSDHYNFAKHKIPIIFYFNGLHADYHRPGDDVDKIDFNLAQKSARLVFLTAWQIANRDVRLRVDRNKP
jgi:hypothetical protein